MTTITEAASKALETLEAVDVDALNDVAARYEKELAELRAQIRLDQAAFNSIRMALNNARETIGNQDLCIINDELAGEIVEQCEFADMLLTGALLKSQKGA